MLLLPLIVILLPPAVFAGQENDRKKALAVRVASGSIRLDGRLDEAAWRSLPAITEFVQKEPVEGAPPTDRMDVRFAYDETALDVGARMYATDPIQAPMGRRGSAIHPCASTLVRAAYQSSIQVIQE